jgi:hypothetical protein
LEQIFGLLVYASYVLGTPTFTRYYAYKLVRRRFSLAAKGRIGGADARVWPSTYGAWHSWVKDLLTHPGRQARDRRPPQFILITDASKMGFGGICFALDDSACPVRTLGGTWMSRNICAEKLHINVLEAKSLIICARALVPQHAKLTALVDNTSVMYGVRAAGSKNFALNAEIQFLHENYSIHHIGYIKSADNPADGLSRAMSHDPSLSKHDMQLLVKAVNDPLLETEKGGVDFRDKI